MGSNVSLAIDLAIEKKLNSGITKGSAGKELLKFARLNVTKKHGFSSLNFSAAEFLEEGGISAKKDIYENEFLNYYDSKVKKTHCKFNLLRLFKPGELLSAVSGA